MLASKKHGVLYIGVTNDLKRRVYEHKQGIIDGFTKNYFVKNLVWFDSTSSIESAIAMGKKMKFWKREWKDLSDNL